ncbi:Zn-dependent exopeptidases superfamily protein [Trifolium repens]|nr:Zn-dependent exopeptidases superfamily protein [Trifolium repens]
MDEIKAKVHHHRDKLSLKLDTKAMVLRLRWLLIARERKIVPRSQSFESFCHSHTRNDPFQLQQYSVC